MCDYSLENQISRAAEVGDKLVTSSFPMTPTRGFCAENEAGVAVCLLPGTDEEHKEIELTRTEARQAGRGYNIYVLVFGLGGVIVAFLLILVAYARAA